MDLLKNWFICDKCGSMLGGDGVKPGDVCNAPTTKSCTITKNRVKVELDHNKKCDGTLRQATVDDVKNDEKNI